MIIANTETHGIVETDIIVAKIAKSLRLIGKAFQKKTRRQYREYLREGMNNGKHFTNGISIVDGDRSIWKPGHKHIYKRRDAHESPMVGSNTVIHGSVNEECGVIQMGYSDSDLMKMQKESLIYMIKCLEHNFREERKSNDRQYKMLCEYEKYKWHDIRKNPRDLPEDEDEDVLAYDCGYFIARCEHHTDFFGRLHTDWTDDTFGPLENVIAWRYIEPFEEDT